MNPRVEILPFVLKRLKDAKAIVSLIFGRGTCRLLDKALSNPLLRGIDNSNAGEVVYVDNHPEGFNAVILRNLFYGQRKILGSIGSTLCLSVVARKEMVAFDLLAKVVKPRFGSVIFFGNSANKDGMKVNRALGMDGQVPDSCAEKHIAVLRRLSFAWYLVRSKLLKISGYAPCGGTWRRQNKTLSMFGYTFRMASSFLSGEFDDFWTDYVAHNEGLVCSRTGEELNWMFGDMIDNGSAVCIEMLTSDLMQGYIVFVDDAYGKGWRVGDVIVKDNDKKLLGLIFNGGLKLLKLTTSAVHCEISGFADCFQCVIKKNFPITRTLTNNQFSWKIQEPKIFEVAYKLMNSEKSWFFGPYDGDRCL